MQKMRKTGVANLPLHSGSCPPWLFPRMKALGAEITQAIVFEHGEREFLRRISNPFFFQSLGCLLAFDWHSSGLTTTVCGALKEGLRESDSSVRVLGGKGKTSRKTPTEIEELGERFPFSTKKILELKKASRLSAKVDNAAVQDGYQLYHHSFFVSEKGDWAVVQQGMNVETRYARRYHWLGESIASRIASFTNEPHSAVCSDERGSAVLNMVARESEQARRASVDLAKEKNFARRFAAQKTLYDYEFGELRMGVRHSIDLKDYRGLENAYEFQPRNYEELLLVKGMGPKTIRALALVSELIYGAKLSWRDPARYAFAHGGKDGYPFFTERKLMAESTRILENAVEQARIGRGEKLAAIRRLKEFLA